MGKYLFTSLVVLIVCAQTSAQLEPGKLYTGISSENRFHFYNKNFGVKPEIAYALDKHSSIGLKVNYFRSNKFRSVFSDNVRTYGVSFGAGISYNYFRYFKNSNKLGWYVNTNLELNRMKVYNIKPSGQTVLDNQYNYAELSIRPGIFYTPSQNVLFFANFGGFSLHRSFHDFSGDFNFASEFNIGVLMNFDVFRKRK